MSAADIKLQIIKLLDNQPVEVLKHWFDMLQATENSNSNNLKEIELGYKAMAEDSERETEAFEWIENTLNSTKL